ncbi:MAG: hypothetical protein QXI37_02270 [Thermoprotei archaeon]
MDMCNAVKDLRLAKLYTSRQRCMFEFSTCTIYVAHGGSSVQAQKEINPVQTGIQQASAVPDAPTQVHADYATVEVECEFFSADMCTVLERKLTNAEILRCSRHYDVCPFRERALKKANSPVSKTLPEFRRGV